ncbi:MarR family transcriptional regulator [Sphingomonas baiyangensis]|uniref:MarR family transcriptional regulator n=1 Tax=Sphingomonas baiyangensis TaxID=2572576 RepID=A0A4U1L9U3_9SPHN|nr:MarR family transcriptional regulator [Sphingomonas baiyangensis]
MKRPAELERLLGYQIQMVHLDFDSNARDVLAPFGLTPVRFTALLLIDANPGCDQTALGRALSVNRSSAMKLVNGLEQAGLVERRAGRDLRTNALHLTDEGVAAIAAVRERLTESETRLASRLDAHEQEVLQSLLAKLQRRRAARG